MSFPSDYIERVYAGTLGKIIGVYLGRPFEGWSYDRISSELGDVNYYVNQKLNAPLVVTDDDITGTFTFLRALEDYGFSKTLTAEQIGQTWLNYLIEKKTILWWGGMGNSTEHTAYMRLKAGVKAPESGSIALNGKVVAEQIGAQIFIDGWGMIAPGDPALAADFARKAASVSHDGEAIYGAQVVAAIEAQAFVESDIDKLIDVGLSFVPKDSIIAQMIADIREWHGIDNDWRETRAKIERHYGYDKFGGNCHMVPNHGLIILALLYGEGDFQKSLMIANTSGWDTDCNSGNVGCILGIRNGLAGLENGPDWRGPVADRILIPTADPGRTISDAVSESYRIVNAARALQGEAPLKPKNGARFHFSLPGSVQGFRSDESPEALGVTTIENVVGKSETGERSLAIRYQNLATGRASRVATSTFITPADLKMGGYELIASPTLYPGQNLRATLIADSSNETAVTARLFFSYYDEHDKPAKLFGDPSELSPGASLELQWKVPDTEGCAIYEVGIDLTSESRTNGVVALDSLAWEGTPHCTLNRPKSGSLWRRNWASGVNGFDGGGGSEQFRIMQDAGTGLLIQGCREWADYSFEARITPHMSTACGIAVRVQGMKRYYALLLCAENRVKLVKALDGEKILAEGHCVWEFGTPHTLRLEAKGDRLHGYVDGYRIFDLHDKDNPLTEGAIAFVIEEGRVGVQDAGISPLI